MDWVKKMTLTSIQLKNKTKEWLAKRKEHPRESYDAVVQKLLDQEQIPSMEEMFQKADQLKQKKKYATKDVLRLTHDLRSK